MTDVSTIPADSYRLVASAVNHPDAFHRYRGLFNHRAFAALDRAGVEVDVVSPTPFAPPFGPYSEYHDVPAVEQWGSYVVHHPRFLYALPKRFLYHVSGNSYAKRVSEYIDRTFTVPDVVHAGHIYLDGYGVLPYCRKHDVPLAVTAHGTLLNSFDDQTDAVQSQVLETLGECARVVCVSDALAERVETLVPTSKVDVVPLGADPAKYPVDRKAAIRDELGIEPRTPVVLYCGAFTDAKGIPELVDAVGRLGIPDAHFVCVGHGGDRRPALIRGFDRTPYSAEVRWKVPPLALRRLFVAADLLVLPSRTEGRPMVIYEAMASRTAVLASEVGGVPEQIEDGITGVLVSPRDPVALADALEELLSDRDRLEEMGRHGYERLVERGWTWDRYAERLTALHREIIDAS